MRYKNFQKIYGSYLQGSFFLFSILFIFFSLAIIDNFSLKKIERRVKMQSERYNVLVGLDIMESKNFSEFKGKRVGVITNHTGLSKSGEHVVDLLWAESGVELTAIFGPEHGVRGSVPDGVEVESAVDYRTGVKVFSLYGQTRKPTDKMLENIDVLIFDIQDIGARFYTYISTMALAMEAAAERGIPFYVFDRPNPVNGMDVSGPVLDPQFSSFVGLFPVPVRHGMTAGELALLFNGEGYLKNGIKADLRVIKMSGWRREYWFDETNIPWVNPSPNMRTMNTAVVYPGTCFIEGTNISEGRGTERPFEFIGAPWINGELLSDELNKLHLQGVEFLPVKFTPVSIPGVVYKPKYLNEQCEGIFVKVTNRNSFKPVETGIYILWMIKRLFAEDFRWRDNLFIDKLYGSSQLRNWLDSGKNPEEIIKSWSEPINRFKKIREKYLIY